MRPGAFGGERRGPERLGPGNFLAGALLAAPFLLVAFPFLRMARRAGFGARIDPAAIIAGLEAPDDETRVAAAATLFLLPGPEMHDRAIAHLADPVLAVRLHATRALLSSRTSRQRLYELLAGPAVTEQPARAAALAAVGDVMGPTSPYRSWLKTGVLLREPIRGVLTSALVRVATPELALPLLEAAAKCQVMPYVHPDHLGTVPYPNMCCVCGAANPTSRMQLRSQSTGYGVTTWTIGVPVCAAHRSVSLSMDKGSVLFPKPQVVAALLRMGSWHITGVDLFAGCSGHQRDERNHAVAQPAAQVAPALAVALPTAPAITAAAAPMPVASSIPEQPMAPAIHGSSAVAPTRHSRRLGFGIALGGLALLLGVLMLLTPPAPGNTRTTQDTSGIVMICIGALALPIGGFDAGGVPGERRRPCRPSASFRRSRGPISSRLRH